MTESVLIYPPRSSPLYFEDTPIRIPDDECGGMARVCSHSIHDPQWWFARTVMDRQREFVLVDAGVNVGLFTRQVLIEYGKRVRLVHGYEPNSSNIEDARHNIAPLKADSKLFLRECALGLFDGRALLYEDGSNCGNYSLLPEAMESRKCATENVEVRSIRGELARWVSSSIPVFYKSDVQGYDEILAASIPLVAWRDCICGAILELWRVPGKQFDLGMFRSVIDVFPRKRLLNQQRDVTTDDAMEWLSQQPDGQWDDLGLAWS